MTSRNLDKNKEVLKDLEKKISPVFVINNSSLKPYVELFEYSPENIYQQPLGSLVGFFEIKEYSDDSAYIVNFLTSVLKKEYYINPKRSVTESLDSALHKVNLALSELVKHGNMEWLGKLHAAICVIEKSGAHFSVAGNAKIFLYRNELLSEISDNLAPDLPEPNPLKTFINVSSGRLEANDRILITSEDIFHILSLNDLKKNFKRMKGEKLVQFLKTALSNQLEMIASLVIEIHEKEEEAIVKIPAEENSPEKTINVFSEKAFIGTETLANKSESEKEARNDLANGIEEENQEYTDKKTGHIYVQGEAEGPAKNLFWFMFKEKLAQAWFATKTEIGGKFSSQKGKIAKKLEQRKAEKEKQKEISKQERIKKKQEKEEEKKRNIMQKEAEKQLLREQKEAEEKERLWAAQKEAEEIEKQEKLLKEAAEENRRKAELEQLKKEEAAIIPDASKDRKITELETPLALEEKTALPEESIQPEQKEIRLSFKEKLRKAISEQQKNAGSIIDLKSARYAMSRKETTKLPQPSMFTNNGVEQEEPLPPLGNDVPQFIRNKFKNQQESIRQPKEEKEEGEIAEKRRFLPDFSKIKTLFSSFSTKQKISASAAVLIIIVVPFLLTHINIKPKNQSIENISDTTAHETTVLANEKNMRGANAEKVADFQNVIGIYFSKDSKIILQKEAIAILDTENNKKEYPLPEDAGNALQGAFMQDLMLVFILTDKNKVISFSPVAAKYSENNIDIPADFSSGIISSYMTYLYISVPSENQIFRYPRATGGFGSRTSWLKEEASLAGLSDMVIDDNIYCVIGGRLSRYFKGKSQPITLENSETPFEIKKIYTNIDSQYIYALDAQNGRIVQFDKANGSIIAQFKDESIKNAESFSIDEQTKSAYIGTSNALYKMQIQ